VIKSGQIVGGGKREGKMGEMEGEREMAMERGR